MTSATKSLTSNELAQIRLIEFSDDPMLETDAAIIALPSDDERVYQHFSKQIKTMFTLSYETVAGCFSNAFSNSFDLVTILISIADVSTDILVIYNFKKAKRNVFFIVALSVMILAQLAYAIAFMLRFEMSPHYHSPFFLVAKNFIILMALVMAPFVSFIFYWCTIDPNNCLIHFLQKWFNVSDELSSQVNKNQAPLLVWIQEKLNKHFGFILQGMMQTVLFVKQR